MKKLRYFCETCIVRFGAWLLPRLPRQVTLAIARAIGSLAYWFDGRGRRTALENLRCAFRDAKSEDELRRIARASYQNFARTFLDLFWSVRLNRGNWQEHVRVFTEDPGTQALARETGAVWATTHFGNFELVSLIWGFRDFQFTVVAQDFKNPALTAIFKRLREHSGHVVIPQQSAMLRLMKTLKKKGHAALLTDLNIKPNRAATVIRCFGLQTCVTTLHVLLAQKFGLALIAGVCVPLADGTYEVHVFHPIRPTLDDPPNAIAQQCWDQFESIIRRRPECWMWMYKHWRYLPGADRDPAYPAYANPNKAFARMVAGQPADPTDAGE